MSRKRQLAVEWSVQALTETVRVDSFAFGPSLRPTSSTIPRSWAGAGRPSAMRWARSWTPLPRASAVGVRRSSRLRAAGAECGCPSRTLAGTGGIFISQPPPGCLSIWFAKLVPGLHGGSPSSEPFLNGGRGSARSVGDRRKRQASTNRHESHEWSSSVYFMDSCRFVYIRGHLRSVTALITRSIKEYSSPTRTEARPPARRF